MRPRRFDEGFTREKENVRKVQYCALETLKGLCVYVSRVGICIQNAINVMLASLQRLNFC